MLERGCLLRMVLVSVMGFVVVWCVAVVVRASPCELRIARSRPPSRGETGLLGLGAFLSGAYSEG